MTIFERRVLSPPHVLGERSLAAFAGLALTASLAFLFHRVAPGAPAIATAGVAGLAGLAALALALALDDAALPKLTTAVAASVGLLVLSALVEPEARLRFASMASAAFGVGLTVWLVCTARKRPGVSVTLAALFAVALGCLTGYAAYLVLASRDLMIADFMTLSRHFDHGRAVGRRRKLAAAAERRRPIDHARLLLGGRLGSRPPAGGD
jgi:hypothetical protein